MAIIGIQTKQVYFCARKSRNYILDLRINQKLLQVFIVFVLFLFFSNEAITQSPSLRQITDVEGLPSMTIYDILQDQKGYIWLGTDAGICRYDGYEFRTFQVPKETLSLL